MSDLHDSADISASDVTDETNHEAIQEIEEQTTEEVLDAEDASDDELQDVIDSEDASEEEVAEAKQEQARRLMLKINGEDQEFDLDDDEHLERLKQMAQKGEGADKKFQEASDIRKKMEAFAELLQTADIGDILSRAGRNPDKEIEAYMARKIEQMQKSPEQLKLEELQREIEEERRLREEMEQEKLTAEQARISEEYERQLDDEISSALESSELPKSAYVVKRIAENLMSQIDKGNVDVSVSDVLPSVQKQIKGEIQQMFEAMPDEVIEAFLGENVSNKLRKRRLSRMKKTPETATNIKSTGKSEIKKTSAEQTKAQIAAADYFKNLGDL